MSIIFSIQTYQNKSVQPSVSMQFDQSGGTLGRAIGNELVLEDPGKYISRIHARVDFHDDAFYFTDVGHNPSLVNDYPLQRGKPVLLTDGNVLQIGEYRLSICQPVPAAALPPSPLQLTPVAAFFSAQIGAKDSLSNASILMVDSRRGFAPDLNGALGWAPVLAGFDPCRGAASDHVAPENQIFQLPTAAMSAPAPRPVLTAIPEDYDLLSGCVAPRVVATTLAAPVDAGMVPPTVNGGGVQCVADSLASPAAPEAAAAGRAVIAALLDGLGLSDLQRNCSDVELAQLVGAMLREASKGTMGLLLARTMSKRVSRLEMTMMASEANNPLKFFPSVEMALRQMLGSSHPGYLAPVQAYRHAYDDLKAHELATLAGMRAALHNLLQRFDPAVMEARMAPPSLFEKLSPAHRKARLWDAMAALHQEMAHEADTEFQRWFGEQFSFAYEAQMQRLEP